MTEEIINCVTCDVEKILQDIKKEIYLPEEVLRKILIMLVLLKNIHSKFRGNKELIEKLTNLFFAGRPPKGILLYGPPGTGKSYLMDILKRKVFKGCVIKVSGPEIISAYYGESERNLRKVFRRAAALASREGLGIIFIDEVDSIAPRRDLVKGELEPRLVGQLLTLMDGLDKEIKEGFIVVVASTNRIWALDPALRRPGRFDVEILFDLPDTEARKEILRIYLCKVKELLNDELARELKCEDSSTSVSSNTLNELAGVTEGFSGADIFNLVREAIFKKIVGENGAKKGKISKEDLIECAKLMRPSILRGYEAKDTNEYCQSYECEKHIACDEYRGNDFVLIPADYGKAKEKIKKIICNCLRESIHKVIEVMAPRLRSRWFGETEERLREIMEKFLKLDRAALIIYSIEALAHHEDENLVGVRAELTYYLDEVREANERRGKQLRIFATATDRGSLDSAIISYFPKILPEDRGTPNSKHEQST